MTDANEGKPGYVKAADGHWYHKSSSANATTAPTNQHTIDNAAKTSGLSPDQAEFVTIIDYEWHLKGNLDAEALCDEYGYDDSEYSSHISSAVVLTALAERGIPAKAVNPDHELAKAAGRSKLTPIQVIAANTILNLTDTRTTKKKLQDLGVSPYQYDGWIKDPDFKHYLHQRAEDLLGDIQHEAMIALVDKVMNGDLKALEYYHEITGRYVRQTTNNAGNTSVHDLQQVVISIIEIISEEVDDPQIAARIDQRLKALVMGNQVAGTMAIPEPIVQPEIATAREQTPEVLRMMEQGVGYNE